MYLEYFGLDRPPFQVKADARFLYLSEAHRRARAYLDYTAYSHDGFVVITGEIGSGKTTLLKDLLSRLKPEVNVVWVNQTQLDDLGFLQSILAKLGVEAFEASKPKVLALLEEVLVAQRRAGRQVLLIVDEAQHLASSILEEIRFLAGIEGEGEGVFNFILVGHPELNEVLNAPDMAQLAQRIRLRFNLQGIRQEEIGAYLSHRLAVAGYRGEPLFPEAAIPLLHEYTGGIPRLINLLCDAALLAAYVEEQPRVSTALLEQAIEELQWVPYRRRQARSVRAHAVKQRYGQGRLVLLKKGIALRRFVLAKSQITLGRDPGNDVVIGEPEVSSHHAAILAIDGRHSLRDLESTNGTYLNGERVTKALLRDGDQIGIANYQLVYSNPEARPEAAESNEGVGPQKSGTDASLP